MNIDTIWEASKIAKTYEEDLFFETKGIADVLSISSVGPTVFTITKRPDICVDIFKRNNLNVYITKIENNGYKINKNFLNNNSLFRKQRCLWNSKKIIRLFRDKKPLGYIKKQLKNIKNPKDKKALDLGCGTGRYTELMLKVGFNVNVLDYSKTMLDITKTKMLKFYDKNEVRKRCKKSLIINIPFPNKYFDLIISAGVFHQAYSINDYNQAIKECARVLKKGGILISEIFTSKIIDKKLKRVGARTVKTKEGLFMTLLSKEEFIKMVSKYNLKLKGRTVENIKQIETGVRCILRSTFYKK